MKRIKVNITILIAAAIAATSFHAYAQMNWVYRYNGSGNGSDGAYSLVYGSDGNIYAAGYSTGTGTLYDFTVISFTSLGDTNWVFQYNRSASDYEIAYALAYGADNNIYAAGHICDSITDDDFAVISLSMSGSLNWVYTYGGSSEWDGASAIVYGADGNLYVAGTIRSGSTGSDFTVISLTASGDTRWVYQYASPTISNEGAYAITYGPDGNIYAAGSIAGTAAVVSLTSAGDTNWIYLCSDDEWSAVRSIAYGADGNIYVAGSIEDWTLNCDLLVISLTTTGNENWIYKYDGASGPPDDRDEANSVVYGGDNSIYAAGYSTHSPSSWYDFTIISLSAKGNANWVYLYDGGGSPWQDDVGNSITYGSDGNIYAAGSSRGIGTSLDYLVMSLTTSGSRRWLYRYNGPGNDDDVAWSIDFGADDNIYVAGRSEGDGTGNDLTVISMGQAGYIAEKKTEYSTSYGKCINVSPNPFSGVARFDFCISPLHMPTSLYLYDVAGRVQDTIWQESNQLPKSFIYQPPVHVAGGVYYIVLDVTGVRYLQKVVVVR